MSRCFPFPPPGYEKKLRVEDVTLLAKQKDKDKKEKKHKKDKNKEKKEGREKDKERSQERHKEKDKEKHKHDKDKKNGKKQSRYEKTFEGDRPNVEKVGSNSPQSSCVQELEQRISFVDDAAGNQTVHKFYDRDQGKAELLDGVASRSNGAYWTEGKSGLDQMVNGQRENSQSHFPKVAFVFSNGTEKRKVQMGRPMENNISRTTEGKELQKHHSSIKKGEESMDKNAKRHKGQAEICTPRTFGYNGAQIDPPKDAAVVQELERRIRDENGATGSQVGTKVDVSIPKRAQNSGKVANGHAISFSQTKENSKYGNGCYNTDNGQKDTNRSKAPKVAIVHNFTAEERKCEAAGAVDTSKKVPVEGIERNGYDEKGAVDTGRNKPREEKVKEQAGNIAKLSRFGQRGSDSTDSSKHYTFKLGDKTAEAIAGKRKGPEANGILHDNDTRPNKWQKTDLSSQLTTENGGHLKLGTTVTLPASKQGSSNGSKLDGEKHKPSWTVGAQSLPVTSSSSSVKPMGPSPLGMTNLSNSAKASGKGGGLGSPYGSTRPQPSTGKVPGKTGSQESSLPSAKPPLTGGNANGTVGAHGQKAHETVACQESAKPPLILGGPGSPYGPTKPQSSIGKVPEKTGSQESSLASAKPPLAGGNANGTIGAHGQKAHETVGCQESAKPPLNLGNVNGTIAAHGSPPVKLKRPSSSGKEKRKDKSSSKPLPPHPDTKYLSRILSVPKMEELSEFDDPEWLFKSKSFSLKESDVGYDRDREVQVWDKAVHIDSADVYALPYVIPY